MKAAARRALAVIARPIWRRVWARIETRIETRVAIENAKLHREVGGLGDAWHLHVPTLLNVAASVGAIAREQARMKRVLQIDAGAAVPGARAAISEDELRRLRNVAETVEAIAHEQARIKQALQLDGDTPGSGVRPAIPADEVDRLWDSVTRVNKEHGQIWKRIEFVRSELLYEMRYGAGADVRGRDPSHETVPARIVNGDKVQEARKAGLRLNLGCGHVPLDGYVNVDMRDLPGVDVVARVDTLPFEPGEVSEIFSSHVLEHFTQAEFERKLLPYWVRLLAPGGTFRAIVPDAAAMIRAASEGAYPFDDFRKVFFGGQDYDGDFHFNMFCTESLANELRRAGLTQVEVVAEGRQNDIAIELELVARKPAH